MAAHSNSSVNSYQGRQAARQAARQPPAGRNYGSHFVAYQPAPDGIGWWFSVSDGRHQYRVESVSSQINVEAFSARLKAPDANLHNAVLIHRSRSLYLPEDMERLMGVPVLAYDEYVVIDCSPNSNLARGGRYNPSLDPGKRMTYTKADENRNERRREAVLQRWDVQHVDDPLPPRFA
jgi:hypothetical protein